MLSTSASCTQLMNTVVLKKTKQNKCACGLFSSQYRGRAAAPCWDFARLLLQAQQDVFRLDVRVDDFTLSVKVVQALQNLQETQHNFVRPLTLSGQTDGVRLGEKGAV